MTTGAAKADGGIVWTRRRGLRSMVLTRRGERLYNSTNSSFLGGGGAAW
jgi:hypothetical protein